jgi:type IV pilus assembly protein PilC
VPQFAELFSGFGAQLPLLTQIVIGISNLLRQFWWLILLSLTVLFWILFMFKRHCTTFTKKFDTFILRAPIFGKILQKAIVTRLMQTLAITFTAGVPLLEALQLLRNIANNAYFHRVLGEVHASICEGQTLSQSLRMSKLLPNIALQMVAIGEEAGKLPHMLAKAASFYENEVNQLVDNLSQLLEPLIMAVLGIIVGGLVIAMYLPIFKLGTVI